MSRAAPLPAFSMSMSELMANRSMATLSQALTCSRERVAAFLALGSLVMVAIIPAARRVCQLTGGRYCHRMWQ